MISKNLLRFSRQPFFISLTMTVTLLHCITSSRHFSLSPLTRNVLAELDASSFLQKSDGNRIKFRRQRISTTANETFFCLPSLFYSYDIPSLRNCKVKFVFLPDAPEAFHLADEMYHFISDDPNNQMKNDSGSASLSVSTLSCQACLIGPTCKINFFSNNGT